MPHTCSSGGHDQEFGRELLHQFKGVVSSPTVAHSEDPDSDGSKNACIKKKKLKCPCSLLQGII